MLDRNGDGMIQVSELDVAFKSIGDKINVNEMLIAYEMDDKTELSFEDFLTMMVNTKKRRNTVH